MNRFYRRTTNGRPYVIITTPVQFIVISDREGKTLPYRI